MIWKTCQNKNNHLNSSIDSDRSERRIRNWLCWNPQHLSMRTVLREFLSCPCLKSYIFDPLMSRPHLSMLQIQKYKTAVSSYSLLATWWDKIVELKRYLSIMIWKYAFICWTESQNNVYNSEGILIIFENICYDQIYFKQRKVFLTLHNQKGNSIIIQWDLESQFIGCCFQQNGICDENINAYHVIVAISNEIIFFIAYFCNGFDLDPNKWRNKLILSFYVFALLVHIIFLMLKY